MPNIIVDKAVSRVLLQDSIKEVFKGASHRVCPSDFYAMIANLCNDLSEMKTSDEVKDRLKLFYTEIKESTDNPSVVPLMQEKIGDLLKSFYRKLCDASKIGDSIEFGHAATVPKQAPVSKRSGLSYLQRLGELAATFGRLQK